MSCVKRNDFNDESIKEYLISVCFVSVAPEAPKASISKNKKKKDAKKARADQEVRPSGDL
jgi:hypothetical protein